MPLVCLWGHLKRGGTEEGRYTLKGGDTHQCVGWGPILNRKGETHQTPCSLFAGFPKCEVSELHAPALRTPPSYFPRRPVTSQPWAAIRPSSLRYFCCCCCCSLVVVFAFVKFRLLSLQQENNWHRQASTHKVNVTTSVLYICMLPARSYVQRWGRVKQPSDHQSSSNPWSSKYTRKDSSEAAVLNSSSAQVSMPICREGGWEGAQSN